MKLGLSSRLTLAGMYATILLAVILLLLKEIFLPQIKEPQFGVESLMVLAIILGVSTLLSALTLVAVVFSALKLENKKQALGLPEGSIRAIIALCLIILFVIMAIYLFNSIGPRTRIIENAYYYNGTAFTYINGTAYIPIEPTENQVSTANGLITTVGTLVVALAGFYFGTRAVEVAKGAVEVPALSVLTPTSPVMLAKTKGTELIIGLQTTPEGEAIQWSKPEGDDDGMLVQEKPNQFKYTRGSSAEDVVTLKFKLAKYPDATAELTVEAPALRVTTPSPAKLVKTQGETLKVELETKPTDEPVEASIEGDTDGTIEPEAPGKFNKWTYTRGSSAEDVVTLKFKLAKYPDATAELTVEPDS